MCSSLEFLELFLVFGFIIYWRFFAGLRLSSIETGYNIRRGDTPGIRYATCTMLICDLCSCTQAEWLPHRHVYYKEVRHMR